MSLFGWLAASQPAVLFSYIISTPATSHLSTSSIFLSQQISTSHHPPASRTSWIYQDQAGKVRQVQEEV
jgi:hypothetical protein